MQFLLILGVIALVIYIIFWLFGQFGLWWSGLWDVHLGWMAILIVGSIILIVYLLGRLIFGGSSSTSNGITCENCGNVGYSRVCSSCHRVRNDELKRR